MEIVLVSKCSLDIEQYVEFKMSVLIFPSKSLISSRWVTFIFKSDVIIQMTPLDWCNNILTNKIPQIKCKNNRILRMRINDVIFCFTHLRWYHNRWASIILIMMDTCIHHSKYWMPIHYVIIRMEKAKISSFIL